MEYVAYTAATVIHKLLTFPVFQGVSSYGYIFFL